MQLLSVNVGRERSIENAKPSGKTGIYKIPVDGMVRVTTEGVSEDVICDTENHGGVDQAVYIYGTPDYEWWSNALGKEIAPGTFGENLTITEFESARALIGDRFRIRSVILEVTAPRVPCVTLSVRMGDPSFAKRFREAERPGVYCRVVQGGLISCGDAVSLERYAGETVSALQMFRDFYEHQR